MVFAQYLFNIIVKTSANMKFVVIFVLGALCYCRADELVCQLFDVNSNSLELNCKQIDGKSPENCSNDLNFANQSGITQLKIKDCDNKTVVNVLEALGDIHVLDISYSDFEHLNWLIGVSQLERLEFLNASHNRIIEVPADFATHFRHLTVADLSHNQIRAFNHSGSFNGAVKLSKIHLSHNLISTIESDTFVDSPYLEYIDLRENELNTIPIFPSNENVKVIHLEDNQIVDFDCSSIPNQMPISLYLPWKNVFAFDQYQFCEGAQIRIVPHSTYDGIVASADGSFELHCGERSFDHLHLFTAARDAFKNVADILPCFGASIKIVIFSGNVIEKFNTTNLDRFIDLQRLHLSHTALTEFNVYGIKNKELLLALDLSHNNLTQINDIGLLWNLEELDVSGNQLLDVPQMIQELPQTVTYLDLSNNFVGELNVTTFERLTELQSLKLASTNLSISYFNPFERLQNLLFLDISQNNLVNVNFTSFSKTLNKLIEFNAANCQISDASEILQYFRPSLEKLNLSGNFIGKLDQRPFEWLINLNELSLSNTNLTLFDEQFLEILKELKYLDLSYNKLEEIDLKLMTDKLEFLNLEGNELRQIDHFDPSTSQFITLGISDNQLPCAFLKQIKRDFSYLSYLGDPLQQKHGRDCQSSGQAISDFLGSVYEKVKFW